MSKVIKIQSNLNKTVSYNTDNIESVFVADDQQKIKYQTVDEYVIPYGTYATLKNYKNIVFDKATQNIIDNILGGATGICVITESTETPTCDTMQTLYDQYLSNYNDTIVVNQNLITDPAIRGVVVINRSEVTYNTINVSAQQVAENDFRITDISLSEEDYTEKEVEEYANSEDVVIIDFDEIYEKCAKYWHRTTSVKCSAFASTSFPSTDEQDLATFTGGFGTPYIDDTDPAHPVAYNIEYWKQFSTIAPASEPGEVIVNDGYTLNCGKYYLTTPPDTNDPSIITVKDTEYTIYDVLFRYIYEYLYEENPNSNNDANTNTDPYIVKDPAQYTFLLKTYKMYVKNVETNSIYVPTHTSGEIGGIRPGIHERITSTSSTKSVDILSIDEIKQLTLDEAKEYAKRLIVYSTDEEAETHYTPNLILSKSVALQVLQSKGCGQYLLLPDNLAIQAPSKEQYEYYDLGNFELTSSNRIYKYTTAGKIAKLRQIYNPDDGEYYVMSQTNAGEFIDGYSVQRKGVHVRCVSGKEDLYYFENDESGENTAEQLKEDILYAMEDGPAIVVTQNLLGIE